MFQNNKVNLIISIVAAIGLWAYVFFEINPTKSKTISEIPVKMTGIVELQERGLTVRSDDDYVVEVKIKGPRSEIAEVAASDIEATADVSSFTAGENDVKVKVTVPDAVKKEDVSPSVINVVIEEYVTESKPVEIKFEGTFEEDTEPGFVSRNPETMEVSGAKSLVKNVSRVEAVVASDRVKEDEQTLKISPVPVDKEGNVINGLTLAEKEVSVKCTLCYLKTVPLEVPITGEIDSQYEVTAKRIPDSIRIKGIKSQISKINKVKAQAINISNIKETTEIPIKVNLPEGVEVAKESENLLAVFEISGITVKNLSYEKSDINIRNLNSSYSAQIEESKITVAVYGKSELINGFAREDITLYIDLKDADYSSETYTAKVKYTTKKNPSRVEILPANVSVTFSE